MPTSATFNSSEDLDGDPAGRGAVLLGFEVTFAVLMCTLSVVGNVLVLWIIWTSPSLRNVTNLFIQNLACIDILLAVLQMPLWIVTLYHDSWILGKATCQWSAYILYVLSNASLYTLLMIALNRYVRVVKYEHYSKLFGDKRVPYALIALTWVLPMITCSGPLYGWGEFRFYQHTSLCTFEFSLKHISLYVFLILLQPSPYVIVFCYFKIYARVRKNRIQVCSRKNRAACQSAQDAENKTMYVAFAIICVFIVSWTPAIVLSVRETLGLSNQRWLAVLSSFMVFMSSFIHPVIYGLLNPSFKEAFIAKYRRRSQDNEVIPMSGTGCTK